MSVSKACVALLVVSLCASVFSHGQTSRKPLIAGPVDSSNSVTLAGSKHQLVQPRFDVGAVDAQVQFSRILLALTPSAEAQADLQTYMDHQQDRTSPDYHHWLTPEEFGAKFGPAPQDILTVKSWLEQQGLQVTSTAKSGLWMEVSGTSGQVERAFQTQMRQYRIAGETHIANASELSIPAALIPVVRGVVSLHNFFKKSTASRPVPVKANADGTYSAISPNATSTTGLHALSPGDYANIYNINSVYSGGINGAGVKIGLVARNDVSQQDFLDFRRSTNLPVSSVTNVLTLPPDPGFDPNSGDTVEATLDAQWSSAVAPGANIQVIVSASTATTDGVDLSSAYAVDHNLVDVLSVSFGQCEANLGAAENSFFNSLWEQAAAQGISVFVSSGDSGSAGCDNPNLNGAATGGLAVSGLASTPFNTAVGGTQFSEGAGDSLFWSATNAAGFVSANGYLPEAVWNESCNPNTLGSPCAGKGFSLFAGSGGQSQIYTKPTWQAGLPVSPADTSRDIPDVSLTAALHDGYLICFGSSCGGGTGFSIVGGTSASSPSFAGIMALIDQALGGRQGLANYALYRLSKGAAAFCTSSTRNNPLAPPPAGCIFNDITTGNNAVPVQSGFNATAGFDLATGLGSVNVANLISAWGSLTEAATTTTLSSTLGNTISVVHGTAVPLTVNVTNSNTPAPSGSVALLSSLNTVAAADSVALTVTSSTTSTFNGNVRDLPGGAYSLTAHYPGDSVTGPSSSAPIPVTITPETSTTVLQSFAVDAHGVPQTPGALFTYGSLIDFQAIVAGSSSQGFATGNITYKDATAGVLLGSAALNSKGEAGFLFDPNSSTNALAPGVHTVTALYSGDSSFKAGPAASLNVTIDKGTPGIVIDILTFMVATQSGTLEAVLSTPGSIFPTGTVQLFDDGVPIGTPVQIPSGSKQINFTTAFANEGFHPITASYSGDSTYHAALSPVTNVSVAVPFFFSGSVGAVVAAGQTATFHLNAFTSNNPTTFNGTVTFTCTGIPAGATCSISPASVLLTPTTPGVPFTVTVTTSANASLHKFPFRGLPYIFAAVFALAISMSGSRKQLWHLGVVALLAVSMSSCGGGSSSATPAPTPPTSTQTTFAVTGTSGTHTNVVDLTLTITH